MAFKGTAAKSSSGASMSKYDVEVEARLKKLEAALLELEVTVAELKTAADSKVNFQVADLFEYKIEPVDLIVSLGVLHHTEDCMGALTKICQSAENHIFIGLYHKYGRKPFLEEFKSMDNEDKMFERYCELDSRFTDETHLRSWFRDQVLHPHETTHTMEEVNEILYENNMELIWSSIEGDEKLYEDLN